jgi:hypothetical protein
MKQHFHWWLSILNWEICDVICIYFSCSPWVCISIQSFRNLSFMKVLLFLKVGILIMIFMILYFLIHWWLWYSKLRFYLKLIYKFERVHCLNTLLLFQGEEGLRWFTMILFHFCILLFYHIIRHKIIENIISKYINGQQK